MARRTKKAVSITAETDPNLKSMPPALKSSRLLPLARVHESDFEEICVEIAEREENIIRADLKRIKGVAQYGVDVEGFSEGHAPVLVLSCKRYQSVAPSRITAWNDEFFDSWEHWKDMGVERFVLALTVELNNDDLNAVIRSEALRFRERGIRYEVWGLKQLTTKLRPLPLVVGQYFNEGWVPIICGPSGPAGGVLPSPPAAVVVTATAQISNALSLASTAILERFGNEVARRLASALAELEKGISGPLRSIISDINADRVSWDALSGETKARLLVSETLIALRDGDIAHARKIHSQGQAYDSSGDRRVAGLISYFENGAESAIAALDDPLTAHEAGLYAALLLEIGRVPEAVAILDRWTDRWPDADPAEPIRLRAFARAIAGERAQAVESIARIDGPGSAFSVRWTSALLRFNFALSPLMSFRGGSFPNPIAQVAFREDDEALDQLDLAERIFLSLAATVDEVPQRRELEVWRLACLMSSRRRASDATAYAQELLSRDRPHPGAVVWAAFGGQKIDIDGQLRKAATLLDNRSISPSEAVAAAYLLVLKGNAQRAINFLRKARKLFTRNDDVHLIDEWLDDIGAERSPSPGSADTFERSVAALVAGNPPVELLGLVDSGDLDALELLTAFEALMAYGQSDEVHSRSALVLSLGVARSVEIAAFAAFNCGHYARCTEVLTLHLPLFRGGTPGFRARRLLAQASISAGRLDVAIDILERFPATDDIFPLASTRLQIGDVEGAVTLIRKNPLPVNLPAREALRVAVEVVSHDRQLAYELVRGIDWQDVADRELPAAIALAANLGLGEAMHALGTRLETPGTEAHRHLRMFRSEAEMRLAFSEMKEEGDTSFEHARQLWLRSDIPMHLMFEHRPEELFAFIGAPFRQGPTLDSAGRPPLLPLLLTSRVSVSGETGRGKFCRYKRLVVDVAAVLLGHRCDVLEHLGEISEEVLVPHELVAFLRGLDMHFSANLSGNPRDIGNLDDAIRVGTVRVHARNDEPEARLVLSSDDAPVDQGFAVADLLVYLVGKKGLDLSAIPAARALLENATNGALVSPPRRLRASPQDIDGLRSMGLLGVLADHFDVCISPEELDDVRARSAGAVERALDLEDARRLRRFVAERLAGGDWHLLPAKAQGGDDLETGLLGRSLYSVLEACGSSTDVLWIEDRLFFALREGGRGQDSRHPLRHR